MAFNINAQVILSGPKNIKAVTSKIQKQLSGLTATVNIKIPQGTGRSISALNNHISKLNANLSTLSTSSTTTSNSLKSLGTNLKAANTGSVNLARSQGQVNTALKGTNNQLKAATSNMQAFGQESARAIKRFGAFTIATGTVFGFIRAVQTATKEALNFERELVKLEQITGKGGKALDDIRKTVDQLSNSLGVDANEVLKVGKTFAQTGQTLQEVKRSMDAVARSSLAPTFGTMASTTEGLIAAMAQFNIQARDSEKVLGSLNAVSKRFAVESSDLISAVRRAGGVFAATANQTKAPIDSLNELISIFTAVRSTTRETADTIATGLRTIFSRIQRPRTIEFLKQFNIELLNTQGNFIGTFESFQALSKGLQTVIRQGDVLTLARITEELGGIRQVGKLIPAIKNFEKALTALDVARQGALGGLQQDVDVALRPLGRQFDIVAAQFKTFIREVSESRTFQRFARVALETASAFIKVADSLRPLIPLVATLASIKIAKGAFAFGRGFVTEFRGGGGAGGAGSALGGGITGGGGGGSAQQVVAQQSATRAMNSLSAALKSNSSRLGTNSSALGGVGANLRTLTARVSDLILALRTSGGGRGGGGIVPLGGRGPRGGNPPGSRGRRPGPLRPFMRARGFAAGGTVAEQFPSRTLQKRIYRGRDVNALRAGSMYNAKDRFSSNIRRRNYASRIPQGFQGSGTQLSPNKFEQYVALLNNSVVTGGNAPLDIVTPGGRGIEVRRRQSSTSDTVGRDKTLRAILTGQLKAGIKGKFTAGTDRLTLPDIQVAQSAGRSITGSAAQRLGVPRQRRRAIRRAAGGSIFQPQGTDTVPAMLTPGEFVINRASAQRIGYGNLEGMNRLAKGGVARSSKLQYFQNGSGGGITPTFGPRSLNSPTTLATTFNKSTVAVNKGFASLGGKLQTVTSLFTGLAFTLAGADFTSLSAFTASLSDALPTLGLVAALQAPDLINTFTNLAAQGGKAASAFSLLSGPAGIGGLVALLADSVVSGVTSAVAGSLDERLKRRAGQPGGLAEAELTGGLEGAFTRGLQAGGIGAVIGTAIAGPVGAAVGGAIGVVGGAIGGAIEGSGFERALQNQADALKRLTNESDLLDNTLKRIISRPGGIQNVRGTAEVTQLGSEGRMNAARVIAATQNDLRWTVSGMAVELGEFLDQTVGDFIPSFFDQRPGLDRAERRKDQEGVARQRSVAAATHFGRDLMVEGNNRREKALLGITQRREGGFQSLEAFRDRTNDDIADTRMRTNMNMGALRAIVGKLYKDLETAVGEEAKDSARMAVAANAVLKQLSDELVQDSDKVVTTSDIRDMLGTFGWSPKEVETMQEARDAIDTQTLANNALSKSAIETSQRIQAFKLAFEVFNNSIDQEIGKLGLSMTEGVASIADLSSSVLEMRNIPFRSVVRNLETSTTSDIDKAVKGVASVTGDSSAFTNVEDLLKVKKALPDILRTVVNTVADQTAKQTEEAQNPNEQVAFISKEALLGEALTKQINKELNITATSEDDIPSFLKGVRDRIVAQLTDPELLSRQSGGTTEDLLRTRGPEIIRKALEDLQPILEAFAKVEDALNTYKSNLLLIGNEQLKLSRQQVANDLELNKRRFDISDRANRVLGRPERRGLARGRLDAQLRAIVGSPDQQAALRNVPRGGVRIGGAGTAGRLLQQRTDLEAQRNELKNLFQEAGKDESSEAAKNINKNTEALERNKKALNMLGDDVTVLSDLEQQAARVSRQEQNAQAGILGLSGATDQLLTGTREGFEAFTSFTEPLNALIRASHNQVLRPDEARGLIEGIQGGDPVLSTLLDALPGGADQARELKQNLVRNLAQDTAMKLSKVGGAPGTFAQLLPIFEKAYTTALDRKTGIAGEIEEIGRDQNRILTENMRIITENATAQFGKMNEKLNQSFEKIAILMKEAEARLSPKDVTTPEGKIVRGVPQGEIGRTNVLSKPIISLLRSFFGRGPGRMSDDIPPTRWQGDIPRFANGGYVRGPSHGSGGVMANLEGGEYVVPKKYAQGGVAYLQGGGGPSFSNFWENFKYQFGFGSPETIKKHQEASRGTYGGSNIPAVGIGGGRGTMTGMSTVKGWLKHGTRADAGRGGAFGRIGGSVAMAADTREKSSNYWENRRPGQEVVQEAIKSGAHGLQRRITGLKSGVKGAASHVGPAITNLGDHLAGRRKLRVGVHHSDLEIHKKISQGLSAGAMMLGYGTTPNELATPQPQKLPESALAPENLTDKPFMRLRPEGGMARDAAQIYTPTEADARKAAAAASQAGRQQKIDEMGRAGRGNTTLKGDMSIATGSADAPGMKAGAGLAVSPDKGVRAGVIGMRQLTDEEWEAREKRRREDPTLGITGHYATDVPARHAASAATAAGVGVKSPRGVMGAAGKGAAYSPILDQAGADFQAAFSAGRERVVSQKRAEIREKARLAKVQADNAARADKLWGPIDPKTGKRSGGLEQGRVLARKAESTRMHEQMAEIKKKSAEGMPWEKRDRERREKTQAAIKASEERKKKAETAAKIAAEEKANDVWAAEGAAKMVAEEKAKRDAAIEEQKQRRIARTRERYRKEGRYKGGMRRRGAEMPVEPGVTGGVAGPTEQQNRARARNQSRAAARRQARQRRLGLIPQAAAPARGGGGFFGTVGRAIGNLFGGGRGRQPAAYGGGLTFEQKEEIQRKRRQKLQDARARQQARQRRRARGLAGGGSVFKPKGTDTVPAMLTPGEYVIRQPMVDRYGEKFMNSINEGTFRGMNKGGKVSRPQYLYNGGSPEAQATAVVENEADMGRLASALTNSIEPLNRLAAALEGFNSSPKDLSLNITGQQTATVVMGPKVPQEIAQIAKTEVQQNAAGLMRADGSGPDNSLQNLPS